MNSNHLLVGCSFTDPLWQSEIPWSLEYSKIYPSYIVAKAGMGIAGICTEALYYIKTMDVGRMIVVLPTLWRLDIEVDEETYLCNSMVDLLYANDHCAVQTTAQRKWLISGGLHFKKDQEYSAIFNFLYKHKGFLVIIKEHIKALTMLIDYCKMNNIEYTITAIQDPMDQLQGLDFLTDQIAELLDSVDYKSWFRFNGVFIDKYLGHNEHPTTVEHVDLCNQILLKFK